MFIKYTLLLRYYYLKIITDLTRVIKVLGNLVVAKVVHMQMVSCIVKQYNYT